jgi:DNA integrity scanning protein DisA with diadenylate cyclase activity
LRHRSALGLAEQTDAKVIIVSEETGKISLAHNNQLHANISPEALQQMLIAGD